MTPHELEAIISGIHGDPFSILGPHQTNHEWEVRAFLPEAAEAAISVKGALYPMKKIHAQGLFVSTVKQDPGDYKLRITLWSGADVELEDPYRFPPLITDFDIYLYNEGTNFESFRTLGAHISSYEGIAGVR